jgi:uncharacterized membrane protein YeaQ/YmgE (transglycosylase-associated protein family)
MQLVGLFAGIIIGAIAGWLAGIVMKSGAGVLTDMVVGITGAFMGGVLFNILGFAGTTGFNIWSLFVGLIGAVVLISMIHLLNGRERHRLLD